MKKVYRILSVVLILILALGMTVFAETEGKVVVTIGNATDVNVGDTISLPLTLECANEINSIGISGFEYNDKILKFVGFSETDAIEAKAMFNTWLESPMVVSLGFSENVKFTEANGKICTLNFEVLTPGKTSITAEVIARKDSEEFETLVIEGKVQVLGKVESGTYTEEELGKIKEELVSERKQDVIALKLNASSAYTFGKMSAIDPDNSKVVPYLNNNRTLVPLRFVSENLGAEVLWENGWDYCYVVKNDKKIKITFNSDVIEVDGKPVKYDAPVEVVENRTMVPIRFISEELGYDVKWNQANQIVIITPLENPWVEDGQIEKDVLEGILVTFLFNGMF